MQIADMLSVELRLCNHDTTLLEVRRGASPLRVIHLNYVTDKRLHKLHLLAAHNDTQDVILLQLGVARCNALLVFVVENSSYNEVAACDAANLFDGLAEDCVVCYTNVDA